jgi:hypothetical protein
MKRQLTPRLENLRRPRYDPDFDIWFPCSVQGILVWVTIFETTPCLKLLSRRAVAQFHNAFDVPDFDTITSKYPCRSVWLR